MSELEAFVNHRCSIITNDGRVFVGELKGFDQTVNIVLANAHERVFSGAAGAESVPLGLYIVRGDNIAIIGEVDEILDAAIDLAQVHADALPPVVH